MRTYLITYDLSLPTRHNLAGAIMQLGDAWARPLDATWYVQSSERADALERRLKPHLEGEDGLLIQQVEADAVLLNTALDGSASAARRTAPRRAMWLRSLCLRCLKPRRPEPLPPPRGEGGHETLLRSVRAPH